jgi:hypothetical protein
MCLRGKCDCLMETASLIKQKCEDNKWNVNLALWHLHSVDVGILSTIRLTCCLHSPGRSV